MFLQPKVFVTPARVSRKAYINSMGCSVLFETFQLLKIFLAVIEYY